MKVVFSLILTLAFTLLAGTISYASGESGAKVIKVGLDGETPPYTTVNDKGELIGLEMDVWREIGKRIGYEIQFERAEFSVLFGMLDDGRLDTVANTINPTPEREARYYFSPPVFYERIVLISRSEKQAKTLQDINGWTLAVEPASSDESIVDAIESKGNVTMKRVFYDGLALQDVVLGRVDLWMKSETGAMDVIKKIGNDKIKILMYTPVEYKCAYPFAKTTKGKELVELVNGALKDMHADGTLSKLSHEYFGFDITKGKQQLGEK